MGGPGGSLLGTWDSTAINRCRRSGFRSLETTTLRVPHPFCVLCEMGGRSTYSLRMPQGPDFPIWALSPPQYRAGLRLFRCPCNPAYATTANMRGMIPHAESLLNQIGYASASPVAGIQARILRQSQIELPHSARIQPPSPRKRVAPATPGCRLAEQSLSTAAHWRRSTPSAAPPPPVQAPAQAEPTRNRRRSNSSGEPKVA